MLNPKSRRTLSESQESRLDIIKFNVPKVNTKNRVINTPIPAPGTEESLRLLEQYESRSMQGQIPIIWDKAHDFNIYDKHGNKWIDFTSTICFKYRAW